MMRHDQLDVDRAMVLAIDLQEKLLPLIPRRETILSSTRKLLAGANVFGLPVVVTEQNPRGIGSTHVSLSPLIEGASATLVIKSAFSAWADEASRGVISQLDRPQIILCGIETHVCVQQTALDLCSRDYLVCVCADGVGSRGRLDHDSALGRISAAGVIVTSVESVLFELCGQCDAPRFKEILAVIKEFPPATSDG